MYIRYAMFIYLLRVGRQQGGGGGGDYSSRTRGPLLGHPYLTFDRVIKDTSTPIVTTARAPIQVIIHVGGGPEEDIDLGGDTAVRDTICSL